MANLVMTLSLIARGRGGDVLRSWLVGSAIGAGFLAFGGGPETRTVTAFVVAEAAAFVAMLVAEAVWVAPPPDAGLA
jgi:hypothetical protein